MFCKTHNHCFKFAVASWNTTEQAGVGLLLAETESSTVIVKQVSDLSYTSILLVLCFIHPFSCMLGAPYRHFGFTRAQSKKSAKHKCEGRASAGRLETSRSKHLVYVPVRRGHHHNLNFAACIMILTQNKKLCPWFSGIPPNHGLLNRNLLRPGCSARLCRQVRPR